MIAWRPAFIVVGPIPFVAALGQWATFAIFGFDDHRGLSKSIDLMLIGLGLALSAFIAERSGARWWTPAWVVAAAGAGVVYFFTVAIVLFAVSDDEGGCPGGRIYC